MREGRPFSHDIYKENYLNKIIKDEDCLKDILAYQGNNREYYFPLLSLLYGEFSVGRKSKLISPDPPHLRKFQKLS